MLIMFTYGVQVPRVASNGYRNEWVGPLFSLRIGHNTDIYLDLPHSSLWPGDPLGNRLVCPNHQVNRNYNFGMGRVDAARKLFLVRNGHLNGEARSMTLMRHRSEQRRDFCVLIRRN